MYSCAGPRPPSTTSLLSTPPGSASASGRASPRPVASWVRGRPTSCQIAPSRGAPCDASFARGDRLLKRPRAREGVRPTPRTRASPACRCALAPSLRFMESEAVCFEISCDLGDHGSAARYAGRLSAALRRCSKPPRSGRTAESCKPPRSGPGHTAERAQRKPPRPHSRVHALPWPWRWWRSS